MTSGEIEEKLAYLLDRQEILDLMTTYCRAVDRLDREMLLSVYHEDGIDDHVNFVGGREEFWDWVSNQALTHFVSCNHHISNHIAEIDGDTAHAETYFIVGVLNKVGAPFTLVGGRYIDRLEKRNGKWGIVARNMIPDWWAPSINTIEGAKTPEGAPNFHFLKPYEWEIAATAPAPARNKSDTSYTRPLTIPKERVEHYQRIKGANMPDATGL
jgi:SnoaL-like domain